jgi:hypothetical protein
MPKAQTSTEQPSAALDTETVDKKLEETIESTPVVAEVPPINGTADTVEAEEALVAATKIEDEVPTPEAAEKAVEEEIKDPEKPQDPVPSPVVSRLPSTTNPAAPAQPAAPPKPLSWASRAAAAVGSTPKPAVPVVAPKTSTPPAQSRAAPPAQAAKPAPVQPASVQSDKEKENNPPGGWQTAGSDHSKRQNRPQSISVPPEKEGTMGYVKNVTEKVGADELRAALGTFGELIYFDVNRGKVRSRRSI